MKIRESELATELDIEKTGTVLHRGKPIHPLDLKIGSNKFVWWRCSNCNHSWEMMPNARSGPKKTGCTYCGGRAVHSDGRNSLETKHPDISAEFIKCLGDITSNPKNLREKSGKKCLWECKVVAKKPCGHIWSMPVKKRTHSKQGCTYCGGRSIHIDGRNSLAKLDPKLSEEFHPTKNGDLDPNNLMVNSNFEAAKSIWWICKTKSKTPCGHHWQASPNARKVSGCPSCHGTAVHSEDARNSLRHHPLFKELDPDKNTGVDFARIRKSVNDHFWWLCQKCGNSYFQTANNRVSGGQGCPDCSPVGFQNTKPGHYYVHQIDDSTGKFKYFKAGISNDWKKRFTQLKRGIGSKNKITHIESIYFKIGKKAREFERLMIDISKAEKWKEKNEKFDGGTELFSKNPISRAIELGLVNT